MENAVKAVVYFGPGHIEICDRPEPEAREDNLLLEIACCAICGTDVKLATIGHQRWAKTVIIGHELVGRIIHAGSRVQGFAVGERVTMATTLACGHCPICARGLGNLCPKCEPISMVHDGAFARRMAVPALALAGGNVIKVPQNVSDEAAALSEPMSCAINAQELAGLKAGDRVVIVGGGPLGAIHAELARAAGAERIMVVQRSEPRLTLLRKLRGVTVIDGAHEDVKARVLAETDGLGADVVEICAPDCAAQEKSLDLVRNGGAISLFSSLPKGDSAVMLDSRTIHYGELRVVGCSDSRPEHVRKAVGLLTAGKVDAGALITHRLPLSKFHEGIELMKRKESFKVIIVPGET
jgi:L-iditol 2-dehydrogenase